MAIPPDGAHLEKFHGLAIADFAGLMVDGTLDVDQLESTIDYHHFDHYHNRMVGPVKDEK